MLVKKLHVPVHPQCVQCQYCTNVSVASEAFRKAAGGRTAAPPMQSSSYPYVVLGAACLRGCPLSARPRIQRSGAGTSGQPGRSYAPLGGREKRAVATAPSRWRERETPLLLQVHFLDCTLSPQAC